MRRVRPGQDAANLESDTEGSPQSVSVHVTDWKIWVFVSTRSHSDWASTPVHRHPRTLTPDVSVSRQTRASVQRGPERPQPAPPPGRHARPPAPALHAVTSRGPTLRLGLEGAPGVGPGQVVPRPRVLGGSPAVDEATLVHPWPAPGTLGRDNTPSPIQGRTTGTPADVAKISLAGGTTVEARVESKPPRHSVVGPRTE